jgi:hypothetical protein
MSNEPITDAQLDQELKRLQIAHLRRDLVHRKTAGAKEARADSCAQGATSSRHRSIRCRRAGSPRSPATGRNFAA